MGYKKPELKSYSAGDILEEIGPCQNQYTTTTFYTTTGNSSVNVDGIAYNGAQDPSNDLGVGDDGGLVARGLFGFDISSIHSTVVSATLRVYQAQTTEDSGGYGGNPYADLGTIIVDHVNFGNSIDGSDLSGNTLTSNIGTISTNSTIEWKTLDVTNYVQVDLNAGRTSSQYRLGFTTDTDFPGEDDYDIAWIEDAENNFGTGNRPELVVTYR